MQIKHVQYEGKWIADVRNDKFAEQQLAINFLPGIGEVDSTGTEAGLFTIESKAALNSRLSTDKTLFNSTDHFGYNLATTAPKSQYQYGELPALINYSNEVLNAGQIAAIGQSLGGYGLAKEIGKDPELAKKYDSIIWLAMGPGTITTTAKNLADAKVPNWFIVCEGDDYSGTHDEVSYDLHHEILRLGGISYLTVFQKGSFKDPHVIFGVMYYAWDSFPTRPLSPLNECAPKMSIFQWALSNKRGLPGVPPDGAYKRYIPPVIVEPAPTPEIKLIKTIEFYSDGTFKEVLS